MIDGRPIGIRILDGPSKASLCLQGTILSLREQYWSREVMVDIPLELTSVQESRRFKGSTLIAALLALLLGPAVAGVAIGAWDLAAGDVPDRAQSICLGAGFMSGVLVFIGFLVRFLMRQKAVTILVAPRNTPISFWMDDEHRHDITELLQELAARRASVAETIPYPMRFAVGGAIEQPWKRTVVRTFLFSIPALMTEIRWLLVAPLVPIVLHVVSVLRSGSQPRLMRKAVRLYLRQQWQQAKEALTALIEEQPDSTAARLFLIELLMRLDDFSGANAAFAHIEDELDADIRQSIQQELILRARISDRKKSALAMT